MPTFDYLIVGGGIAGTTAAATIREHDPVGSIAIIEEEPYRLYSKISLSKPPWFHGKVPFETVWLKSEAWYQEQNIELFAAHRATALDPKKKIITCADQTEFVYKKLLLSTGACARSWSVPGAEKDGVFSLRTLDDGLGIKKTVEHVKQAVLIGGGFISFEMANLLCSKNIEVTVILREKYFWEMALDETAGRKIEEVLKKSGVRFLYETQVQEVLGGKAVEGVRLSDGSVLECQLVVTGIGVVCMNEWLGSSGLGFDKGIIANEFLATNLPDVWTAGDSAQYKDLDLGEEVIMGNWENAVQQGRVAGLNMVGKKTAYQTVSSYTSHAFGLIIAFIGDVRALADRQTIVRAESDGSKYGRLVLADGELIGATLINRQDEIQPIKKLIEQNIKLSDAVEQLADPAFDLNHLLT